ncbi:hypothetical protein ACLB2K_076251 [Fragaria x ananassa]
MTMAIEVTAEISSYMESRFDRISRPPAMATTGSTSKVEIRKTMEAMKIGRNEDGEATSCSNDVDIGCWVMKIGAPDEVSVEMLIKLEVSWVIIVHFEMRLLQTRLPMHFPIN